MASDEEENGDLNYGIDDEYGESFAKSKGLNDDEVEQINLDDEQECLENDSVKVYKKNPKLNNEHEEDENPNDDENEDAALEDLLNLIENDDEQEDAVTPKEDAFERGKVTIKKQKSTDKEQEKDESKNEVNTQSFAKSSIKIERIANDAIETNLLTEKNTGIRLVKSPFKSESEMNLNINTGYGKFFKLNELIRRTQEIKNLDSSFNWYSIFILGSKTESKCSAKGNNYVIWRLYDLNTLDNTQDISLFLFGNAYKQWWKSSEMDVFALVKPEFLDNKNQQQNNAAQSSNNKSYFDNSSHTVTKKGILMNNQQKNWNNFASKKLNLADKLTLSIKSDYQLVFLGSAKDITVCQSMSKQKNDPNSDSSKKCKNLVDLQRGPYCTYHSMMFDKALKKGQLANKGKYSMDKPPTQSSLNRFGTPNLFTSTINKAEDVMFLPHKDMPKRPFLNVSDQAKKSNPIDEKAKIKAERLMSLTGSISQSSPTLSNVVLKTNKKSDQELMALLDGKELDKEEVRRLRLEEQSSVIRFQKGSAVEKQSTEMKKLFNSKLLLPGGEINTYQSVSTQKLIDLKKNPQEEIKPTGQSKLSTMQSHRDILKEIKKDPKDNKEKNSATIDLTFDEPVKKATSIVASDFLARRIGEIKKFSQPNKSSSAPCSPANTNKTAKKDNGFDLELFIGDSVTSKKLLDVNSKYVPFSPSTATSESQKRKLEEMSPNINKDTTATTNETILERKAKRAKMIEEMLKIKSNHSKEVMDPEKNPQLKSYYDKMQLQEDVDNKLCSIRNREVNLVSCKICKYTTFKQSDFCKLKKHPVNYHKGMQRFFKCKNCGKRVFTLDELCPTKPCAHCSKDKYEPCTMKEEDTSITLLTNGDSRLNQESEMFLEAQA